MIIRMGECSDLLEYLYIEGICSNAADSESSGNLCMSICDLCPKDDKDQPYHVVNFFNNGVEIELYDLLKKYKGVAHNISQNKSIRNYLNYTGIFKDEVLAYLNESIVPEEPQIKVEGAIKVIANGVHLDFTNTVANIYKHYDECSFDHEIERDIRDFINELVETKLDEYFEIKDD